MSVQLSSKLTQIEIDRLLEKTKLEETTKEELYNRLQRMGHFDQASVVRKIAEKGEVIVNEKKEDDKKD